MNTSINLSGFVKSTKEVEKSYTEGIYNDSPQNRKLGRVGMTYAEYAEKSGAKDKEEQIRINYLNNHLKEEIDRCPLMISKNGENKYSSIFENKNVNYNIGITYHPDKGYFDITISNTPNKLKLKSLRNLNRHIQEEVSPIWKRNEEGKITKTPKSEYLIKEEYKDGSEEEVKEVEVKETLKKEEVKENTLKDYLKENGGIEKVAESLRKEVVKDLFGKKSYNKNNRLTTTVDYSKDKRWITISAYETKEGSKSEKIKDFVYSYSKDENKFIEKQ